VENTKFFRVTSVEVGERLDAYLVTQQDMPTRSQLQRLIEQGRVKVNGLSTKPSYPVKDQDTISVEIPEPTESFLTAEDIPVEIIYEDDDLVVVNKQAGLVVHPGAGNRTGTLVNALLFHCNKLSGLGGQRPGIVHRLDKETSGVMVVAKNDETHFSLSRQFQDRTVKKNYKALVYGRMESNQGTFDSPIGRHPSNRKKMSSRSNQAKSALTLWSVLKEYEQMSLVKVVLATGRTHQIRVHFSEAGHPVVGDDTYGGSKRLKNIVDVKLRQRVQKLSALMLHAEHLSFIHPGTKKEIYFDVEPPKHFKNILELLDDE
jgi:23S rRNA pseudouridine1911/1915/1917 synthase